MFGNRFFGNRFFGGRYFAHDGVAPAPPGGGGVTVPGVLCRGVVSIPVIPPASVCKFSVFRA